MDRTRLSREKERRDENRIPKARDKARKRNGKGIRTQIYLKIAQE